MRILIVCQYFSPEPFRITDIAGELVKNGHSVEVLTGIPNYPEGRFYKGYGLARRRDEIVDGIRVVRVPTLPRGKGNALRLAANYMSFVLSGSLRALNRAQAQYDVILVYQLSPVFMAIPAIVASKRNRVPMVLYVADLWPESLSTAGGTKNKSILAIVGWVVDRIYRRSELIFVTSKGFIEPIVARGYHSRKVRYIPQYPEDLYRPAVVAHDDPARADMPLGFTVVFTGNIGMAQGLDIVIEAASILSDFEDIRWVLIGDGRARADLESMVAARGLKDRVLFLGRRPMERIPAYLALADAALLCLAPEPLFAVTLPAKIQSYLACGIPIIGSIDGDAARVISEAGAGLVGPAGDAVVLARNVRTMYESKSAERKAYSESALRYFDANFRKETLIAKIEDNLAEAARKEH